MNAIKILSKDIIINLDRVDSVSYTSSSIYFYVGDYKREVYLPNSASFNKVRNLVESKMNVVAV